MIRSDTAIACCSVVLMDSCRAGAFHAGVEVHGKDDLPTHANTALVCVDRIIPESTFGRSGRLVRTESTARQGVSIRASCQCSGCHDAVNALYFGRSLALMPLACSSVVTSEESCPYSLL